MKLPPLLATDQHSWNRLRDGTVSGSKVSLALQRITSFRKSCIIVVLSLQRLSGQLISDSEPLPGANTTISARTASAPTP